jgi:hypothetical protein
MTSILWNTLLCSKKPALLLAIMIIKGKKLWHFLKMSSFDPLSFIKIYCDNNQFIIMLGKSASFKAIIYWYQQISLNTSFQIWYGTLFSLPHSTWPLNKPQKANNTFQLSVTDLLFSHCTVYKHSVILIPCNVTFAFIDVIKQTHNKKCVPTFKLISGNTTCNSFFFSVFR